MLSIAKNKSQITSKSTANLLTMMSISYLSYHIYDTRPYLTKHKHIELVSGWESCFFLGHIVMVGDDDPFCWPKPL